MKKFIVSKDKDIVKMLLQTFELAYEDNGVYYFLNSTKVENFSKDELKGKGILFTDSMSF